MNLQTMNKKRKRQQGQSLVEFVLILPLLLLMIFGIFEFGRVTFTYSQVTSQTRNALRYGISLGYTSSANYLDCAAMQDVADNIYFASTVQTDVIYFLASEDAARATPHSCTTDGAITDGDVTQGDILQIQTIAHLDTIVPFFNNLDFDINYTGQRTITKEIILFDEDASAVITDDDDDDDLDDTWEESYFPGDLTQLTDTGDYDTDGCDDICEFNLGLDPTANDFPIAGTAPSNLAFDWPEATCHGTEASRDMALDWSTVNPSVDIGTYGSPDGYRLYAIDNDTSTTTVVGEFGLAADACVGTTGANACFNVASAPWTAEAGDLDGNIQFTYHLAIFNDELDASLTRDSATVSASLTQYTTWGMVAPLITLNCREEIYQVDTSAPGFVDPNTSPGTTCAPGSAWPEITWEPVHDADGYEIWIQESSLPSGTPPGFTNPVGNVTSTTCTGTYGDPGSCFENLSAYTDLPVAPNDGGGTDDYYNLYIRAYNNNDPFESNSALIRWDCDELPD